MGGSEGVAAGGKESRCRPTDGISMSWNGKFPRSRLALDSARKLLGKLGAMLWPWALVGWVLAASARASGVPSLITQPIKDSDRVILHGNIPPLALPEYDRGLAPDSLPLNRVLLVLKRSPRQSAALHRLLVEQQDRSSPEYHHWLAPSEFGKEFGPSRSDIQQVVDWLTSEGFSVLHVAQGRTVIEFSGTAGLMRQVFRAEIHEYRIRGKSYWANATNPQIPAALAPVIKGIASLNNFPREPMYRRVGVFSRSKATGKIQALYTFACPQGFSCLGQTFYAVGPTDFGTIYNVLPLWSAGINGSGETIAITADSNINPQDVANFRAAFGLPPNPVNVILDGPDPGILPLFETEADTDTEWAGAIAQQAKIDLVVSEDTETTAGVDLSALYVIDNDIAPILSESFGACEEALGVAGNAFENAMFEQAAAEGITVVVAAGDSGPAACDSTYFLEEAAQHGLAVSGNASTPYDVAVGGTDFDSPSAYFSTTNNSTTEASAKSYVPEITWNDTCARSGQTTACDNVSSGTDLTAGGGGLSNCTSVSSSGTCSGGYPKPAWQTGTGVPQDGARDIPDIALFSGDGLDNAFYMVCESDVSDVEGAGPASCSPGFPNLDFLGIGGTSVATPAFAGIMALVDQKMGQPQGNANFVLYPLAAAAAQNSNYCLSGSSAVSNSSCVFYDINEGHDDSGNDISPGNNDVACKAGSPDCTAPTGYSDGILTTPSSSGTPVPTWTTSPGYDLATGLGSINVANLVNNWGSVSFHPSSTTLSLSPTTITHGQSVTVNIGVTSSSGTPTGQVELMGNTADPSGSNYTGITDFTLNNGAVSTTTNMLPGGTYSVLAHYAGDGFSGASDSSPVTVTVNPESSQTQISFFTYNPITNTTTGTNPTPPQVYGLSLYLLRVNVLNSADEPCAPTSANGQVQPVSPCPTGTVTLTDNGNPLNDFDQSDSASLNSQGYLEDQSINLNVGSHNILASYSGDASFSPSSTNTAFTISPAPTKLAASVASSPVTYGNPTQIGATLSTQSLGAAPTGTFTFVVDGAQVGNPVPVYEGGTYSLTTTPPLYAWADAISTTAFMSVGTHTLSAQYSGDTNYQPATSPAVTVTVTQALPIITSLGANPSTITLGQQTTLSAAVYGSDQGAAPTGTVTFYDGGNAVGGTVSYSTTQTNMLQASLPYTPTTAGTHNITASYSGDANYLPATTPANAPASLVVQTPDFQITGTIPIVGAAGGSVTGQVSLGSVAGFAGAVNLTCAVTTSMSVPAQLMPTCLLNPNVVTLTANQSSTAALTVATVAPTLAPPGPFNFKGRGLAPLSLTLLLLAIAALMMAAVTLMPFGHRRNFGGPTWRSRSWSPWLVLAATVLGAALTLSCGGGAEADRAAAHRLRPARLPALIR